MGSTSHILVPDDLHFSSMDMAEDMTRYVSGGYHPVIIGDILGPSPKSESCQYRIVHKLGFGSYSTVWLAQKTDSSGALVAVKITTAECGLTREAAMLEAASNVQATNGHALNLLDHFTLHGPNGTHSVLVIDVVAPILSLLTPKRPPLWRKAAAHGLTQAVTQLHAAGVVHGDLHLGNVGLTIPQLADQDPGDVMQDLSPYELTVVLPKSAANQTPSLPAYVVGPCHFAKYYDSITHSSLPQTTIFDFGSAHEVGSLPQSFQCAVEATAPELAFARVVEKADNPPVEPPADVWALGAAIYEIVTGSSLFHGIGMSSLPHKMAVLAGAVPTGWRHWYGTLSNPPQVSPSSANSWWASRREAVVKNCADEVDADALIALLRKILVLDPIVRPTAAEVLQDPWFLYAYAA